VQTEAANGSPVSRPLRLPPRSRVNGADDLPNGQHEASTTPPGTEIEVASDATPTQLRHGGEAQYAKDVRLRPMDYLPSRPSMQQLQARDKTRNGDEENADLSAASPYSVD
jgi:hypothetical protein